MIKFTTTMKRGPGGTSMILARVQGVSDERLGEFAESVAQKARENAAALPFDERTGSLEHGIDSSRVGASSYKIETTSGHASYIEFGTRFIEGKMPFLWPAYRAVKRRFMRKKWV